MTDSQLIDQLNRRLDTWELRVKNNEQSTQENINKILNVNAEKDLFLKKLVKDFMDVMKIQPQAAKSMVNSTLTMVEGSNAYNRMLVSKVSELNKNLINQREGYEKLLAKERAEYNRVIDALLERNRRCQGKDDLGKQLMQMVSQREDEIKQKYIVMAEPRLIPKFNYFLESTNQSFPRLN